MGDAHRPQAGPDPGADSRRPQWGQYGSWPTTVPAQKGQLVTGAELEGTRVLGTCPGPAGASCPPGPATDAPEVTGWGNAVLARGLPQSMQ